MSMVSVALDEVKDLAADWVPSGTGFVITAHGGSRHDMLSDRVTIILTDAQVAELRWALDRPKPSSR